MRLPLLAAHMQTESIPEARTEAAIPRKRILVVDDNRDAAESLGMVLKFLGADVMVANDGPRALGAFDTYQPEAVLLDIGMPGMDGYEVARRLRQQSDRRDVAIIALTGWGQGRAASACSDLGW